MWAAAAVSQGIGSWQVTIRLGPYHLLVWCPLVQSMICNIDDCQNTTEYEDTPLTMDPGQPIGVNVHCTQHPIREQPLSSPAKSKKNSKTFHRWLTIATPPSSIVRPIAIMPLSRMENTTFAMPSIIDLHDKD
ncbi:hypothetical protein TNCV_4265471 [Trichonephila clavipes]|nr:hypothetical protein TNCV_4265471 [Trichonephila clavipes]